MMMGCSHFIYPNPGLFYNIIRIYLLLIRIIMLGTVCY